MSIFGDRRLFMENYVLMYENERIEFSRKVYQIKNTSF